MSRPRWLTTVVDRPGAALLCVPHAGAGSLAYRAWAPHLTGDLAFVVAVLPGRDHRLREPPSASAAEVIEALGLAIAASGRRHVLFGHSMGALVAFGVAQWLRDNDFPEPVALVVSAGPAPHVARAGAEHLLEDDAFADVLRRLGGTPDDVFANPVLRGHALRLLRADLGLLRSFEPAPGPVSCPILAMHARHDSRVGRDQMREWVRYTSSRFRFTEFDGDHFAPVNDAETFVRVLERDLTELCGSYPGATC